MDERVTNYIESLDSWKVANLKVFRSTIHKCDSEITEDWKWNVPVFMKAGKMVFAMSAFKEHTKYNFIANGATINDPDSLFNNGLESKKSRGIDLREGESIDTDKLASLISTSLQHL